MTDAPTVLVAADGQNFALLCYSVDDTGQAHVTRRPVVAWQLFPAGGFEDLHASPLGVPVDRGPGYVGEGVLLPPPDSRVIGPWTICASEDAWRHAMEEFAAERRTRDAEGATLQ
jgi:hypothetical protein